MSATSCVHCTCWTSSCCPKCAKPLCSACRAVLALATRVSNTCHLATCEPPQWLADAVDVVLMCQPEATRDDVVCLSRPVGGGLEELKLVFPGGEAVVMRPEPRRPTLAPSSSSTSNSSVVVVPEVGRSMRERRPINYRMLECPVSANQRLKAAPKKRGRGSNV